MSSPPVVRVVIPGPPVAQGRGRAVATPAGVRVFDPKKSRSWKGVAQVHMREAMNGGEPFTGPVKVCIDAHFPCPTSDYRKRKRRGRRWHTKANGDIDNIAKACFDAANGILWIDDRQVCEVFVTKIIAAQEEPAQVVIQAIEIPELPPGLRGAP